MFCFEHQKRYGWSTRNVSRRTQGMLCFEHTENSASNTRNVVLRTQRTFCFEHKVCSSSNTKNVLFRTPGMSCLERTSFRTTKVSHRCSFPIVIDFTSRLISYSHIILTLANRVTQTVRVCSIRSSLRLRNP